MGGLGNQLFQVAACIATAQKLSTHYALPVNWENAWMFKGDFNQSDEHLPRYHEKNFHYNAINEYNVELYGYFQSEEYFKHAEGQIRYLFSPSDAVKEKISWKYDKLLKKNTCAVHVRRGDYLKLSEYHYNLETEYYTSIMEMLDFHYVCFSDDPDWCAKNIPAHEFISDSLAVDFHLMSMMKNHIIANSSFSWWTSYLCPNKDKLIFAPQKSKWFGEKKKNLNVNDLYCPNWIYEK